MDKIGIIGGGLAPNFNEAMANQILLLSKKLNAQVITCNDIGFLPFKRMDQYLIINSKFILNKTPILSFFNGVILYIIVKLYEMKFNKILVPGGFDSQFLNYLNLNKCIPIVTSLPSLNEEVEKNIKLITPKLNGVIAQSKRVKSELMRITSDNRKIHFMYPLLDLGKFKYSEPSDISTFKILFASAPTIEDINEFNFENKGVPLLLETFKEFSTEYESILYILWRGKYNKELYEKIHALNLHDSVIVIDEIVDMPEIYANIHITTIPFVNLWRSPDLPLSAIESMACGRPVVATDVVEISGLIKDYNCGSVSKPYKKSYLIALKDARKNYFLYQQNCNLFKGLLNDISIPAVLLN